MSELRPIRRLLIANRGEVSLRVQRAARALGITTIAVYSSADRDSPHVTNADLAVPIGPPEAARSYLDCERILAAARLTAADAIHPGYGFLSENAGFARACEQAGLIFVGPRADAIEAMADKALAKRRVAAAGVPCLDGIDAVEGEEADLLERALALGWPLMIKARAGGGGRGMRLVSRAEDLKPALDSARSEASASFADARLLIERALQRPRHIEVQVFADRFGSVIHLGERECSIQRRHQKLVEEAPAAWLSTALRERLHQAALAVTRSVDYEGAGTIEFLVDGDSSERFYFMEMNTRLQVEHAVTEAITGLDLVQMQLQVAGGARLAELVPGLQAGVHFTGHAIEARLCAEDAAGGFLPGTGELLGWQVAAGARVDHALTTGMTIGSWYDSLLAKVVVHGRNRDEALDLIRDALERTVVLGVTCNRGYLANLVDHAAFRGAASSTHFIAEHGARGTLTAPSASGSLWAVAAALIASGSLQPSRDRPEQRGWTSAQSRSRPVRVEHGAALRSFGVEAERGGRALVSGANPAAPPIAVTISNPRDGSAALAIDIDGVVHHIYACLDAGTVHLQSARFNGAFIDRSFEARVRAAEASDSTLHHAPINGRIVAVVAREGTRVARGDVLVVIEAMKMEHPIVARQDGTVAEVAVPLGAQVAPGQLLVRLEPIQ
jgi:geranyl-CoA carboxylase alpha subunit